ncbi:MAG: hypothetical protein ACI9KN_002243, partial [Gammaproteobacteria bacterium]
MAKILDHPTRIWSAKAGADSGSNGSKMRLITWNAGSNT